MRKLVFAENSDKKLRKLAKKSPQTAKEIVEKIARLRDSDSHKSDIKGYPCYKARVGKYRIIYELDSEHLIIIVIDHRDSVYKKMIEMYSS